MGHPAKRRERPPAEPAIRLFRGPVGADRAGTGLSPDMTVPEFYEAYVLPDVQRPDNASDRTVRSYRETMQYWAGFSGDPALADLAQRHYSRFVAGLRMLPGRGGPISENTVRKHCVQLKKVLKLSGPDSDSNPLGTGLVLKPPYVKLPAAWLDDVEDVFEPAEVEAWLRVCQLATRPTIAGISPAGWWRALIRYLYNVGVRIGSALEIRWSWHFVDRHGLRWLKIPTGAIKGHRGKDFYVNQEAWEAIEAIRTDRELVFPWDCCRRHLDTVREQLLEKSGLPADRRFGFHALRKAMCTDAADMNPLVAQKQAGHAALATTRDHYVPRRIVAKVMEAMPGQRQAQLAGHEKVKAKWATGDPRQKLLFDGEELQRIRREATAQ